MYIPRIKEIRERKGLKQNYVAKEIGASQQQMSDWERGKNEPRASYLFKLAEVMNCEVGDLYIKKTIKN